MLDLAPKPSDLVTPPLGIERSQGKARRVIDKRPKD